MLSHDEARKFLADWCDWAGFSWAVDALAPEFFQQFDKDNSGYLSRFELKNMASGLIDQGYVVPKI